MPRQGRKQVLQTACKSKEACIYFNHAPSRVYRGGTIDKHGVQLTARRQQRSSRRAQRRCINGAGGPRRDSRRVCACPRRCVYQTRVSYKPSVIPRVCLNSIRSRSGSSFVIPLPAPLQLIARIEILPNRLLQRN